MGLLMRVFVLFFSNHNVFYGLIKHFMLDCRGLWNSNMRNRMWELIKKHQPQIVFLVETRANKRGFLNFANK